MQALALADDTTGALEIGALFAKDGVPSLVSFEPLLPDLGAPPPPALTIDLQTRHLPPEDAYTRTISLCRALPRVPSLYKKTDSALRGNIAAEFQALLDAFPEYPLVYLPAYPALGRTVSQGRLFIHGLPLSQTAFAQDALNPSTHDFIPDLLKRNGCPAPIVLAPSASAVPDHLEPGSILIGDATTSRDLEDIAAAVRQIGQPYLAAGPGAFAALWIRSLALPRTRIVLPLPRRLLVVSGSAHPVSREQIRIAGNDHVVLTTPDEWEPSPDAVAQRLAQSVHDTLRAPTPDPENKPNSVATPTALPNETGMGGSRPPTKMKMGVSGFWATSSAGSKGSGSENLAEMRSQKTTDLVTSLPVFSEEPNSEVAPPDGLIIFGGDTAWHVLRTLGVVLVEPRGELLPGIPVSIIRVGGKEVVLVTKAGSFGSPGVVREIREKLDAG